MSVISRFYGTPALSNTLSSTSFSLGGAGTATPALSSTPAVQSADSFTIPEDMLAQYPELGNITDPEVLKGLSGLPTLQYDDIPYGPGFTDDKKGRPSQYLWGSAMRDVMGKLGFYDYDNKKVKLPTTIEEIDKWKWMDAYLKNFRQNLPMKQHPTTGVESLGPEDWGFDYYKKLNPDMTYSNGAWGKLGYAGQIDPGFANA